MIEETNQRLQTAVEIILSTVQMLIYAEWSRLSG
jgi:hypothetical protein